MISGAIASVSFLSKRQFVGESVTLLRSQVAAGFRRRKLGIAIVR
jgi:hypothetical protein